MADFSHVRNERLRAVLEQDSIVSPCEFEWAMQYTRDCIQRDEDNEHLPEEITTARWYYWETADALLGRDSLLALRRVWTV